MDGNIDEVRNSHKGAAQPPSLVPGVRWIDDSTGIWTDKVYDGGGMLNVARIDSTSDLVMPVELRRKNLIWNGAMDCWQDGTSETGVTASSNRVADGYRFSISAQGTWTLDRSTTVPTVAQAGRNINFAHRCLVTTLDATTNAGDFAALLATVEGFDYQELYQQPQHLSFWVRSTTTGTYCVALRNSTADRSFVFEYTINAANTYELKEFVLRDVPSGGTWDFQAGKGLEIAFTLAAGATFQTTANAWQAGNFLATSAQTNLAATLNNDFFITDIRLHGGTVRSPVIVRSFPEILREAQRRFWKTFEYGMKPAQNVATNNNALTVSTETATQPVGTSVFFPVVMRANGTKTTYNPNAANANWRNTANTVDAAATIIDGTDASVAIRAALGANDEWRIHVTADARFT